MQPVAHVLEYYKTKLAWGDAADWPHVHLRERVRHYEILNARQSLRHEDAAQIDLEDLVDKQHHLKQSLRNYVLEAIHQFASNELGQDRGWQDSDLPGLFKTLDAHLNTILKRHGSNP